MAEALSQASLIIVGRPDEPIRVVPLRNGMVLGRKTNTTNADISIDSKIVSRQHGRFYEFGGRYSYSDLGSMNGTYINERFLMRREGEKATIPQQLNDGDILRIDRRDFDDPHGDAVTMIFSRSFAKDNEWFTYPIKSGFSMNIGIGSNHRVAVNNAGGAANMAEIFECGGKCFIKTVRPDYPVFVNNMRVTGVSELHKRSVIRIADTLIFVLDGKLVYNVRIVREKGLVVNLVETAVNDGGRKKTLLRNVNIEVYKGDFVLILGGSGAGKSTFIHSVLGQYKINGEVFVVGGNQNSFGYVPQHLTLRGNEKLKDVISDTVDWRSRVKLNPSEKKRVIDDALSSLGLLGKGDLQIKNLSGGEQKRAAIANELVTDPGIFFLDEPDSGLDPGSGLDLMRMLKAIADKGKIIMCISHNYASYPEPEKLFGKMLVLAKSDRDMVGQLAFMGTVPEALRFFGVSGLHEITRLINPRSENGEGRADEFIDKFRGWRS